MRRLAVTLATVVLAAAVTSCSDDGEETSTFCDDREQLERSIDALADYDPATGVDGFTALVDQIGDDLSALRSSAADEATSVQPEIDDVTASVEALGSALTSASSVDDVLTALGAGLDDLGTSLQALAGAAESVGCD